MNKNDWKLLFILLVIILILFIIFFSNQTKALKAHVYYENDLILELDLNINNTYTVKGNLGDVLIEVKDKKIKVLEETSNYHLCSKQGYISKVGESIICLPNRIIISLPNDSVDTEVQ